MLNHRAEQWEERACVKWNERRLARRDVPIKKASVSYLSVGPSTRWWRWGRRWLWRRAAPERRLSLRTGLRCGSPPLRRGLRENKADKWSEWAETWSRISECTRQWKMDQNIKTSQQRGKKKHSKISNVGTKTRRERYRGRRKVDIFHPSRIITSHHPPLHRSTEKGGEMTGESVWRIRSVWALKKPTPAKHMSKAQCIRNEGNFKCYSPSSEALGRGIKRLTAGWDKTMKNTYKKQVRFFSRKYACQKLSCQPQSASKTLE